MAYKTVIDENGSIGYNLYFENTYGNKIKYTTFGANLEEAENIFVHVCGDEGRTAVIYQGSVINAIGDTSQNPLYGIEEVIPEWQNDSNTAYVIVAADYISSNNSVLQNEMGDIFGSFLSDEIIAKNSSAKTYTFGFFSAANEYGYLGIEQVLDPSSGKNQLPDVAIGINTFDCDAVVSRVNGELFINRNVMISVIRKGNSDGNGQTKQGQKIIYKDFMNTFGLDKLQNIFLPGAVSHANVPWLAYKYQLPQYINNLTGGLASFANIMLSNDDIIKLTIPLLNNINTEDIVSNSTQLVESFTSSMADCITRVENTAPIKIENDITGIGEFINGYINSYNKITQKLYSNLKQEAESIQSYSNLFEVTDEELANKINE